MQIEFPSTITDYNHIPIRYDNDKTIYVNFETLCLLLQNYCSTHNESSYIPFDYHGVYVYVPLMKKRTNKLNYLMYITFGAAVP
jgi:hypothetical protein